MLQLYHSIVCVLSCLLLGDKGLLYVEADQKCKGSPMKYNGKRCASTTTYSDFRKGSCGCGPDDKDIQFAWNRDSLVAATSQHLFDRGGKAWCGAACGKCFRLTSTGGWVDRQGEYVPGGQSHVFMATNVCPNTRPTQNWCNQSVLTGYKNEYGYGEHFVLENGGGQITAIGWNGKNPEVTWELIDCDWDVNTPNLGMYSQCFCSSHSHEAKK